MCKSQLVHDGVNFVTDKKLLTCLLALVHGRAISYELWHEDSRSFMVHCSIVVASGWCQEQSSQRICLFQDSRTSTDAQFTQEEKLHCSDCRIVWTLCSSRCAYGPLSLSAFKLLDHKQEDSTFRMVMHCIMMTCLHYYTETKKIYSHRTASHTFWHLWTELQSKKLWKCSFLPLSVGTLHHA